MYALTKADLNAIKQADSLCVSLSAKYPDGLVSAIKRNDKTEKQPFATDLVHIIGANVGLYLAGYETPTNMPECFGHMNLYKHSANHVSSVFAMLKPGDLVTFQFYPNAHSNGYSAAAGLHCDTLRLLVQRKSGKQTHRFEFDLTTETTPDNSARMCKGVPFQGFLKEKALRG